MAAKYIILNDPIDTLIIFGSHLSHDDVADKFDGKANVASAGFCVIDLNPDNEKPVSCFGYSRSLELVARSAKDARIIEMNLGARQDQPPS